MVARPAGTHCARCQTPRTPENLRAVIDKRTKRVRLRCLPCAREDNRAYSRRVVRQGRWDAVLKAYVLCWCDGPDCARCTAYEARREVLGRVDA